MGLFKELMNAVENRLYGTGATATAKENNGVQMILIQTGKALQALYVGSILNEMAAGILDAEEGAEEVERMFFPMSSPTWNAPSMEMHLPCTSTTRRTSWI